MNWIPSKCESASGPDLIIFMQQCGQRDQYTTRLKLMDEVKITADFLQTREVDTNHFFFNKYNTTGIKLKKKRCRDCEINPKQRIRNKTKRKN